MRWDELFADLEAQLDVELAREGRDLALEAERLRRARLTLCDRLRELSRGGHRIRVLLSDGEPLELRIASTGADWVAGEGLRGQREREVIVPVASVVAALPGQEPPTGERPGPAEPIPGELAQRLGMAFVLRDLSRRRVVVELHTAQGVHHGVIARVGADHLDLRDPDATVGYGTRVIPFTAVLAVWI